MLVLQDQRFSKFSFTWEPYSAFFQPFLSSTTTDRNRPCFRRKNRHSNPSLNRTSSKCLSHKKPYKFPSRGTKTQWMSGKFSLAPVIRTFFCLPQKWFRGSQIHVVKKCCRFVKINVFHQFLPHGSHFLLLSSHLDVIHVYRQE